MCHRYAAYLAPLQLVGMQVCLRSIVPVPQRCHAQIAHLQYVFQLQTLDKLAWFGSMKGVASLVADAMKEDGAHALSDVSVALQAAHLLVWQHETEHGEACLSTLSMVVCALMHAFASVSSQAF